MSNIMARMDRDKGGRVDDSRAAYVLRALGWRPRDAIGFVLGAFVTVAILVNVLFMQSGSHPAPMFKGARPPIKPVVVTDSTPAAAPRPRPLEPAGAPALPKSIAPIAPRPPGEIINDIQRELARRGYYDGAADGLSTASTTSPSYPPYSQATLVVHVLADGEPLPNARIAANFMFPGTTQGCSGFTDATGTASCSVQVPEEPSGAEVQVVVQVAGPHGESATTSTTFNVRSAS